MKKEATFNKLKRSSPLISVGILTADMMNLGSEIQLLEEAGVQLLHIDVMDGKIWDNITVGPGFVGSLKTNMLKDVHLLIDKPEKHIENFVEAGADIIIFSVEYCDNVSQTLSMISKDVLAGLSLNPQTPVSTIAPYINDVDIVLLLAVGPDTGKQSFVSQLPEKIAEVKKLKDDIIIFVDGSVKKDNIAEVAAMGANVIITGSAVFDGKDAAGNAKFMMETVNV